MISTLMRLREYILNDMTSVPSKALEKELLRHRSRSAFTSKRKNGPDGYRAQSGQWEGALQWYLKKRKKQMKKISITSKMQIQERKEKSSNGINLHWGQRGSSSVLTHLPFHDSQYRGTVFSSRCPTPPTGT